MRYGSVKHIALYYKAIPGMLRLLRQERTELEGNYYGLRGLACDGMPRGSSPGKPTEESGLRALENGVSERLAEIAEAERVLSGDEACIRACLDALNGKYKEVIVMRYVRGYSWAKISARMGTADSTARDWHTWPWSGWARCWRSCRKRRRWPVARRARVHNKRQKILACPAGLSKGCFAA